jgi:glutathione S-transferase
MPEMNEVLDNNIRRIVAVWHDTHERFGQSGPFLLGAFTNADAMYVPVATRFRTYCVPLADFGDDGTATAYLETIYAMPEMADWLCGAETEMRERGLL